MAIGSVSPNFPISDDDLITCYNSAAAAFGMVASFGLAFMIARDSEGHVNKGIGYAIVAIPFIGAKLVEHYKVRSSMTAIYIGTIAGIYVSYYTEPPALGYSLGSIASGVTAAAAALFVPRPL